MASPEYRLNVLRTKLRIHESRAIHCKGEAKRVSASCLEPLRARIVAVEAELI